LRLTNGTQQRLGQIQFGKTHETFNKTGTVWRTLAWGRTVRTERHRCQERPFENRQARHWPGVKGQENQSRSKDRYVSLCKWLKSLQTKQMTAGELVRAGLTPFQY